MWHWVQNQNNKSNSPQSVHSPARAFPHLTEPVEYDIVGVVGLIINAFVLYQLWRKKFRASMIALRISITVTTLMLIGFSALCCALMNIVGLSQTLNLTKFENSQVQLLHRDQFMLVLFGPLIFLFEVSVLAAHKEHFIFKESGQILIFLLFLNASGLWMLVPGPCLLQYFALCK